MTTIKEIYCHEYESKELAINLINSKGANSIVIPLQGLFIDNNPNILPLEYFFTDQINQLSKQFEILQVIHKILKKWAPKRLPEKSILAISHDILKQMNQLIDHQIPYSWLESAWIDIYKDQKVKDHIDTIHTVIKDTAHWINFHYEKVVFFGLDNDALPIIKELIKIISGECHWILPSYRTKIQSMAIDSIENWLNLLGDSKETYESNLISHSFESIEDECQQVLTEAKKICDAGNKVAIIAPNQQYFNQLENIANQSDINLYTGQRAQLSSSMIGAIVIQLIKWVQSRQFEALYEALLHPLFNHWNGVHQIRSLVSSFIARRNYSKKTSTMCIEDILLLDCDDRFKEMVNIQSIESLKYWITIIETSVLINNDDYLNFQAIETIKQAIETSDQLESPIEYIFYVCKNTWLDAPDMVDPQLICISPEDLCRFPTYDFFIVGASQECWISHDFQNSYLQIESYESNTEHTNYRYHLFLWLIKSDQITAISFSNQLNQKPTHFIEGIQCEKKHINPDQPHQENFQRAIKNNQIPERLSLSPSSIELYQKCPQSFFFKYGLGLQAKNAMNFQLLFGVIFHNIIEKIALSELKNDADVLAHLQKELPPLMADVFYKKITGNDWSLPEIFQFFSQSKSMKITAEQALSIEIEGLQIKGRPDIISNKGNAIEIIDVKTGQPPTLLDIKRFHYLQLGIYAMMAESIYQPSQISCSIFSKNNKYQPMITNEESKKSVEWIHYREEIKLHLKKVNHALNEQQFQPEHFLGTKSVHTNQCRVCDYYSVCQSKERHQR